jgi:hypothetical protein
LFSGAETISRFCVKLLFKESSWEVSGLMGRIFANCISQILTKRANLEGQKAHALAAQRFSDTRWDFHNGKKFFT